MHEHAAISVPSHSAAAHQPSLLNEPALENKEETLLAGKSIQCSLAVGAPDDPLEDEAEAMADTVMRMPLIQRKCAHCEEEEHIQRSVQIPYYIRRKCAHCEEEEKETIQRKTITPFIQAKSNGEGTASGLLTSRINNSRGNGSSMDEGTRTFMEHRFHSDFSNITIHTGSESVQMNRELNAKAFTVGNDIYFNEGQYDPQSNSGKHLLAHELTHSIQQGDGVQRKKIQRTISPDIENIRGHLSYGVFDWAITNGDVRAALDFLNPLNDTDLADTLVAMGFSMVTRLMENLAESEDRNLPWVGTLVNRIYSLSGMVPDVASLGSSLSTHFFDWAVTDTDVMTVLVQLRALNDANLRRVVIALEQGGYIDTLYANLAESNDRHVDWVIDLMIRIQDFRVQRGARGAYEGSCNPEQMGVIRSKMSTLREWAGRAVTAVDDFININIDDRVPVLLDRYFFHQARTGTLSRQQQLVYAEAILYRLQQMQNRINQNDLHCASPFDTTCHGGIPGYSDGRQIRLCEQFFLRSEASQQEVLFHELMHLYNHDVSDTGYGRERVFEFIPPDRAVQNADSYSKFAQELVTGRTMGIRSDTDTVEGCTPRQEEQIRLDLAFAVRMMQNAENDITSTSFTVQNSNNAAATNFKASSYAEMVRFAGRVTGTNIPSILHISCVGAASRTGNLPYVPSGRNSLVLMQEYFSVTAENARVLTLIAILFRLRHPGMAAAVFPSDTGYAAQTTDDAYNNPAAYAAYARDLSFSAPGTDRDEWNFTDATVRYGEQFQRHKDAYVEELEEVYTEPNFTREVLDRITPVISAMDEMSFSENYDGLLARQATFRQNADRIRSFIDRMHRDYTSLYFMNLFRALGTYGPELYTEVGFETVITAEYAAHLPPLSVSFRPVLRRLAAGEAVRFEDWTEYPTLLNAYRTAAQTMQTNIESYRPYILRLDAVKQEYRGRETAFLESPGYRNLSLDDAIDVGTNFLEANRDMRNRFRIVYSMVLGRIQSGIPFNPANPRLADPARLRQSLREMFAEATRIPSHTH